MWKYINSLIYAIQYFFSAVSQKKDNFAIFQTFGPPYGVQVAPKSQKRKNLGHYYETILGGKV